MTVKYAGKQFVISLGGKEYIAYLSDKTLDECAKECFSKDNPTYQEACKSFGYNSKTKKCNLIKILKEE